MLDFDSRSVKEKIEQKFYQKIVNGEVAVI